MKRSRQRNYRRFAATGLASLLLLAGCASGAESSSPAVAPGAGTVGILGSQGDGDAPVSGGSLKFASLAPVASLDPTKTQATGATGGTEMAAVYDLLIRWDSTTQKYEPQLAKSLQESEDHLTWTVRLREGATFSDGSPVDAAAVVASINRYNQRRGANSELWAASVQEAKAANASTVVFTLKQPWAEFPAMLTFGHGLIVAPSADSGGKFTPTGAGAFIVDRFAPPNDLILKPRTDYWGGKPPLAELNFVSVSGGDQAKIDTLKSGGVQMAYLRNPEAVESAKKQFPGYAEPISLAMIGDINTRPGRPGADVRVRQAMAYAIDPVVLDQRASSGKGMPGTEIFQAWSKWHNDIPPHAIDSGKARQLLDAAKADGYDGHITFTGLQDPAGQASALAIQAMLQKVGFTVTIRYANSATDIVKSLYVDHDFDLAKGGNGLLDPAPFLRLYALLNSTSNNNVLGYKNPQLDALLQKVQTATSEQSKRAALAEVQTLINEEVPFLAWGAASNYVPWQSEVYGAKPSLDSIILLDKAWIKP